MCGARAAVFFLSFGIICFTAGLVYKSAVATQESLNSAHQDALNKAVKGKVTRAAASALQEKLTAFENVARTLGKMYTNEQFHCYDFSSTSTTQTSAYLQATIGLQEAWRKDLRYIYISYGVPSYRTSQPTPLWGDCGCQVNTRGDVDCYYMDTNGVNRYYNSSNFNSYTFISSESFNTVGEYYVDFVRNLTTTSPRTGVWQPPSMYTDPTGLTGTQPQQLVTFSVPLLFDSSGNCIAAAQADFALSYAEAMLVKNNVYNQSDATNMVLLNTKNYRPNGIGSFIATTNTSETFNASDVYEAYKTPFADVNDLVLTVAQKLGSGSGLPSTVAVSGQFTEDQDSAEAAEYEATTVGDSWVIYARTRQDAFFNYIPKWTPSFLAKNSKAGAKAIFTTLNSVYVIGLASLIFLFAILNMVAGCCCAGGSSRRSADDPKYLYHGDVN